MTLYFSMVFGLLVTEMVIFGALIVPLPFTFRRKVFNFISESEIIAKLQYGLRITFIFILILFIDSVNRVYRVQVELSALYKDTTGAGRAAALGSDRAEIQARKFYSQRNMYLTGFTLFLSLILNRTYVLTLENLRLQEKIRLHEGDPTAGGKEGLKLSGEYRGETIGQLKNDLVKKDKELAALKKQSEGLRREYNELSDKYVQLNPGSAGDKKSN
ncbi:hypothetical protein DV738_g5057, partial [Chaetothyriales sp. CBS 135597]